MPVDGEVVRFSLIVDGAEVASFGELASLRSEIEPKEYLDSGSPINLNRVKPPSATLSRGLSRSAVLWTWHAQVLSGDPAARKTCSLVGFSTAGDPLVRYSLQNAWPAKLELGAAKAGSSQVVVETVTLIMDRLVRVNP
jgi:phage tail-like protein